MASNIWDTKKSLSYLKVGSFFLIGFLIFFITILSMRKLSFFKGTYNVTVTFKFAEGLHTSSPVRFCGVDVGEVKKVNIEENTGSPLVYVHIGIQKGVLIPRNSYFIINSLSLFGEKYLEITPPEIAQGYLEEGQTVEGVSPIPLSGIFANFTKTMDEVSAFVKEGQLKTSLENSLANIENITLDLKKIIEDTRNKSGTVGRLLYDDSLYKTTEELLQDLKANPWKLLHKPKESRR